MADQFNTSFIPKKTEERRTRRSSMGFLSFLATLIFILVLVGAGGSFLYERFLNGSIVRKQESLERAREAFEPRLIQELSRLDARIESTQGLFADHRALSPLFAVLEDLTLVNVRFNDFTYAETAVGNTITLQGEATSFGTLALQADEFSDSPFIRDPIFSGLAVNDRGRVNFNFTATIDPSLLVYTAPANTPIQFESIEEPLIEVDESATTTEGAPESNEQ